MNEQPQLPSSHPIWFQRRESEPMPPQPMYQSPPSLGIYSDQLPYETMSGLGHRPMQPRPSAPSSPYYEPHYSRPPSDLYASHRYENQSMSDYVSIPSRSPPCNESPLADKLKRQLLEFDGSSDHDDDDESRIMLKLQDFSTSLRHGSISGANTTITNRGYEDIGRATNELPHIAYNHNFIRITVIVGFVLLHLLVFVLLMIFRTFSKLSQAVAKNSAVLTVIDLTILVITMSYTSTTKRTLLHTLHVCSGVMLILWSLIHTAGHVYLLYEYTAFLGEHLRYFYGTVFPFEYTSGAIMLLALLAVIGLSAVPIRKHRYDTFYFSHIIGWTVFVAVSGFHSYYLLPPIGITLFTIYGKRVMNRWFLRPVLSVKYRGKQFALINLKIRDTWLTRWLALSFLRKNQGNAVVWLSSSSLNGCSRFERHPFSMIEIDNHPKDPNYALITLMISRSGNWKRSLHDAIDRNANRELYSLGVKLFVDSVRAGDFMNRDMLRSVNLLFLLENVGIASFLAFVRFICDPKHRKQLHDRERILHLHYRVDDLEYLTVLNTYIELASQFKFMRIQHTIYTTMPFTFRGKSTVTSNRLNYRRILPNFLLAPGRHYVYMNDSEMVDRIDRELTLIKKSRQQKSKLITVSL